MMNVDRIILELMKADRYDGLAERVLSICSKLEPEEVGFLLGMLRNELVAPYTRKIMLEYSIKNT